jgi:hypothetical protein
MVQIEMEDTWAVLKIKKDKKMEKKCISFSIFGKKIWKIKFWR